MSAEPIADATFVPDAARERWKRLGEGTHRRIIKAARHRRAIPEGQADAVALGWAWVILGPPWDRRRTRWYQYATMALDTGGNRLADWSYMAGDPRYDLVPKVRSTARVVENTYLYAPGPAAPFREPEPGENLKPEWLRRVLWGPGPQDTHRDH
jgi:hypothetical protein